MDVKIIGGVAAGMSAAAKLKRNLKEGVTITVYEKGADLSYGACGMPYFISDEIKTEKQLIARDKAGFEKAGINVRTHHEVIKIDEKNKTLHIKDLNNQQVKQTPYEKLIIASGASAIRLPINGSTLSGIHSLNSLEDARILKTKLTSPSIKTVGVIGASFIGLEMVEVLKTMGKEVHVIERAKRVLPKYDQEITDVIESHLKEQGVHVHLNQTVQAYHGKNHVQAIKTDQGSYEVDFVIEAIGLKPNTDFCSKAFKKLKNGALIVNENLETSIKDVYAAGDCVAYPHQLKPKEPSFVPLGTHANKAGRVIANRLANQDDVFFGVIGSNQLKVMDLEVAMSGLGEQEAIDAGYDAKAKTIKALNQAGYYPGAEALVIKLIYEPSTCRLLGGQIVGKKGAALRINTLAVALQNGLRADQLAKLDLAYAPPFAPVWDPLQTACNQIKCEKKGDHQ